MSAWLNRNGTFRQVLAHLIAFSFLMLATHAHADRFESHTQSTAGAFELSAQGTEQDRDNAAVDAACVICSLQKIQFATQAAPTWVPTKILSRKVRRDAQFCEQQSPTSVFRPPISVTV